MRSKFISVALNALIALSLAGCGSQLPVMDLSHSGSPAGSGDKPDAFMNFVRDIQVHVRCELGWAVKNNLSVPYAPRDVADKWVAKIALTITADDKGVLSPGLIWTAPKITDFVGTLGFQYTTEGNRVLAITYFLTFAELLAANTPKNSDNTDRLDCGSNGASPIAGNLGIEETLSAALYSSDSPGTESNRIKGGPIDSITHHVYFTVTTNGSATPSWKLTTIAINPTAPFYNATRYHTDDLLITMGPGALTAGRKLIPSVQINNSFETERLRSVLKN